MTARELESTLLERCLAAAQDRVQTAQDQREANVFQLAGRLVRPRFPAESTCLTQAGERYFAVYPDERLSSAEVVQRGWIASLPRWHDMLARRLQRC